MVAVQVERAEVVVGELRLMSGDTCVLRMRGTPVMMNVMWEKKLTEHMEHYSANMSHHQEYEEEEHVQEEEQQQKQAALSPGKRMGHLLVAANKSGDLEKAVQKMDRVKDMEANTASVSGMAECALISHVFKTINLSLHLLFVLFHVYF